MSYAFIFQQIYRQNSELLIYEDLTHDEVITAFLEICRQLGSPEVDRLALAAACRRFFRLLAHATELCPGPLTGDPWQNYLLDRLIAAENTFTRKAELDGCHHMGAGLVEAVRQDLRALQTLAGLAPAAYKAALAILDHSPVAPANTTAIGVLPNPGTISNPTGPAPTGGGAYGNSEEELAPGLAPCFAGSAARPGSTPSSDVSPAPGENSGSARPIPDWTQLKPLAPGRSLQPPAQAHRQLKEQLLDAADWGKEGLELLAGYYGTWGAGIFGACLAFRWERGPAGGRLVCIDHPDPITPDQLVGYENERREVIRNTEKFLRGLPAVNILLYGARGTGKSSTVKALLHVYGSRGLRLVELPKRYLSDYKEILKILAPRPQKFIIFIDDLSFEEDEVEYKELKGLLEGSLQARPANVLVYATSNRRHLVKEFFADRTPNAAGGEVRLQDTVQEKLSLAERFGLTVIFPSPDQEQYLAIVSELARQAGLEMEPAELRRRALQWTLYQNGASGRTARQFVDYLLGELARVEK